MGDPFGPPTPLVLLRNIVKDWKMPPRTWKEAANQFAIMFGERFTAALN
jgi:transposase-like protein